MEVDSAKECKHLNTTENVEDGTKVCEDCGVSTEIISYEAEWRYYSASDNRNSRDPSRCHQAKIATRGIDSVVKHLNLPQNVKKLTEKKYFSIVGNSTTRGDYRRSIVAACLFYVYKDLGDIKTTEEVRNMFSLDKKHMTEGIFEFLRVSVRDRTKTIEVSDLIPGVLRKVSIESRKLSEILDMAKRLNNRSKTLNHSTPQSVAAAIVYLYLCMNPEYKNEKRLSKSNFSKKVSLSDITITKLAKEVHRVLYGDSKIIKM